MNRQNEQVELKLIEVIQRLEEVDGVVLKVSNKEDQVFLEYDYEEPIFKQLHGTHRGKVVSQEGYRLALKKADDCLDYD